MEVSGAHKAADLFAACGFAYVYVCRQHGGGVWRSLGGLGIASVA